MLNAFSQRTVVLFAHFPLCRGMPAQRETGLMSVKCILKVFVQISHTDRQYGWLITHTGTFSTVDANLLCFEFRTGVAYLFFYSGSVSLQNDRMKTLPSNKWRKYFTGNAWCYKSHQVPCLWLLAVFKVGSDMVQLWYPGSGFSRNSYSLRSRWRRKKSRILWGCRGGGREGL